MGGFWQAMRHFALFRRLAYKILRAPASEG
jgi:hypothetical protein